MSEDKSTSLVLGSGGARGYAHIGVIRCLVERGYDIRYIAGSSMGALVGGIHAAGKLDDYADWVAALERSDIVRLLDWSLDGSLFKGEKIIGVVRELIGERAIEDLDVGYTAVATDLALGSIGREIWLNRGPLFDAIRASIAVPTVFAPVTKGRRLLADGGIINPLPVAPTLNDDTRVTVAVDLNGALRTPQRPVTAEGAEDSEVPEPSPLHAAYRQHIGQYLDRFWPLGDDQDRDAGAGRLGFVEMFQRATEAMQETITQFRIAAYQPSVMIRIPRSAAMFFDFHRADELIRVGYDAAGQALDAFEEIPDEPA